MEVSEAQLNGIAMFAITVGLDPSREEKIRKCDCESCKAAAVILDLVKDRMIAIGEAEHVRKS